MRRLLAVWLSLCTLTSCASVLAEIPLADGNILVVEGRGVTASTQVSCLRREAVEQIVATSLPADAKPGCNQVVLLSTSSSEISKAISSFAAADVDLGNLVAGDKSATKSKSIQAAAVESVARGIVLSAALASDQEYEAELVAMLEMVDDKSMLVSPLMMAKNNALSLRVANRLAVAVEKVGGVK